MMRLPGDVFDENGADMRMCLEERPALSFKLFTNSLAVILCLRSQSFRKFTQFCRAPMKKVETSPLEHGSF